MFLHPIASVLIRDRKGHTDTQGRGQEETEPETERPSHEPRITGGRQELEEAGRLLPGDFEGAWPC